MVQCFYFSIKSLQKYKIKSAPINTAFIRDIADPK